MAFDALFAITAVLLAVALVRLRPCLFMLCANQLITLRALSLIAELGQPNSQAFLPASVFSVGNLSIAAGLFTLATLILAVGVLWPGRPPDPQPLPEMPRWSIWVIAIYFVVLAASTQTIFTRPYLDPDRIVLFNLNLAGIHALIVGLALVEVLRQTQLKAIGPVLAFTGCFAVMVFTDYLKGSTAWPAGILVGVAFLLFREEPSRFRRLRLVGMVLVAVLVTTVVVRGARSGLYLEGAKATAEVFDNVGRAERTRSRSAEGAESQLNGSQYAAHVLESVTLYESGISRRWKSIIQPIEYTLMPSAIALWLGVERSMNAPEELRRYFVHGGGIYILGELYWNGGWLCVSLVFGAIVLWSFLCDTRSSSSAAWMVLCCCFVVGLMQGIGYGFAQIARGTINGLIALLIMRLAAIPPVPLQPSFPSLQTPGPRSS